MLKILLKNKIRVFINNFWRGEAKKRLRRALLLVVWGILLYVIYNASQDFFLVLGELPDIGTALVDQVLSLMLFILFVMLLLSGTTVALHFIFLSSDFKLLLSIPISARNLFSFKFIEGTLANSTLFFYVGAPVLLAYAAAVNANWGFYPFAVLNSSLFLMIPTGVAIVITLLAVQLIPANRAKEVLTIVMAIVFITVWAGLQFIRLATFDHTSSSFNPQAVGHLQTLVSKPFVGWSPSNLFAASLSAWSHGHWQNALLGTLTLSIVSLALYFFSIVMLKQAYRRDLIGSEQIGVHKKFLSIERSMKPAKGPLNSNVILGTILRDFRLLIRDMRQVSQIMIFAVMMVVFPLIVNRDGSNITTQWAKFYPFFFVLIFVALAAGSLTSKLIPLESKAFWWNITTPHPLWQSLLSKLILGATVTLVLGWVGAVFVAVINHISLNDSLIILLAVFPLSLGTNGLAICVGAYFPNFDWDHPKRMLSSTGNLVLNLLMLIFGGITIGVFIFTTWTSRSIGGSFQTGGLLGVMIMLVTSGLVAVVGLVVATKHLENLEWTF